MRAEKKIALALLSSLLWASWSCSLLLRPEHNSFGDGDADADVSLDGDTDADGGNDADADEPVDADQPLDSDIDDADDADEPVDADSSDADVEADAELDADIDDGGGSVCRPEYGDDIVLFEFEDSLESASGGYLWHGEDGEGCRRFGTGPDDGCSHALYFDTCTEGYLELADSPYWDSIRALDFWFILTAPPPAGTRMGVLSRDANGESLPGHFVIAITGAGQMFLRLQAATGTAMLCSDGPFPVGRWTHVEVLFGEPQLQLRIDGLPHRGSGHIMARDCSTDALAVIPYDIAGNDEPWVLGAGNYSSDAGEAEPVQDWLNNAAIDNLRFLRIRPD